MILTRRCKNLLTRALKPYGYNIGINSATSPARA